MYDKPGMDIPDSVRQMAEKNVEQAKAAYGQFAEMTRKAQEMATASSGVMTRAAVEVQGEVMRFAQQNMEAGFQAASELARARDMKEFFEIQSRHAQRQMQAYAQQAQDLGRLMTEAAQKAQNKS
jgi:phasin